MGLKEYQDKTKGPLNGKLGHCRLIVCDTRDQRDHLARYEFPDDYVVVAGTALYGIRVSEIIDRRNPDVAPKGTEGERYREYWDEIQCRLGPNERRPGGG